MNVFVMIFVVAFFLSGLILSAGKLLARAQESLYGAASPFECGFEKVQKMEFSLRYFLVALVFLLFDLEILLLFPAVAGLSKIVSAALVLLLSVGLFWEWNAGFIEWAD